LSLLGPVGLLLLLRYALVSLVAFLLRRGSALFLFGLHRTSFGWAYYLHFLGLPPRCGPALLLLNLSLVLLICCLFVPCLCVGLCFFCFFGLPPGGYMCVNIPAGFLSCPLSLPCGVVMFSPHLSAPLRMPWGGYLFLGAPRPLNVVVPTDINWCDCFYVA